jgi:LysM repeat protein
MKLKHILLFSFLTPLHLTATEGRKLSRSEYIAMYKDDAIRDMQKMGVPASITMAQALLESSDGNSNLARHANNHFGIKCSDWKGPSYIQDDDTKDECFRKYNNVLESYDDHSRFLRTRPRYAFLFELDMRDYKAWARGLKKAGYATDPHYADRLIKIIEENQLYLLDEIRINENYASINETPLIDEKPANTVTRVHVPPVEVVNAFDNREVKQINDVNYIITRNGDTFHSLSQEFELGYWQLPKYNEMDADQALAPGQIIYLQPKKSEGPKDLVIVKEGDTVHSISQSTGIKMKYILKYNGMSEEQALKPGQKLYLKKRS